MTLKVFLFRSFDRVVNGLESDNDVNLMLISFYLKHGKPQYHTWNSNKITTVKVVGLIETESFLNARFKTARGAASSVFEFTLAELPCLNPYEWISLLHILLKDEQKYEPIVLDLNTMLVSYIHAVGKIDVEIASVLRKKPIVKPKEALFDVYKVKLGNIYKDD
ncbi:unnamed protein product [Lactuca saligna]|uniref:Uncharacterized protein n=1 Tax=Lactuca saligna TaxID=75948 RepID=A0AA35ZYE6_LACSI|nr:unnamed protein product [Lactuca saligna]